MTNSLIRGSFVRGYATKHREYLKRGWDLIQKRDDEYRSLNKAYGFVEKDGTESSGIKSHIKSEYKQRCDDIERRFREPYELGLPQLYDWCRRDGMSTFECLWIDNICDEHLEIVANESVKKADWQMNFIVRKAGQFVERLKADHSVGEIGRLIEVELQHHGYARMRCRRMLQVKIWEVGKQRAMFDYHRLWKSALSECFGSLTAR